MDENHDGKISQLEFIEVGFCFWERNWIVIISY